MRKTRICINLILFVLPLAAWTVMFKGVSGLLSSAGLGSLKYFTVLSNLFESAASGIWLLTVSLCKERQNMHKAEVLKYIASLSVLLTFTTVVFFLGPVFGYKSMFAGANFWFHLIIPLVSVAEIIVFVKETFSIKDNLIAIVPILCYGIVYLGNIILNGRGDSVSGWNDFYGFASWGIPAGILLFGVICLFIFAAGAGIRIIAGRRAGKP